mgnify:CR=1 FL=1
MGIYAPERVWWKPADRHETVWLTVAFLWMSHPRRRAGEARHLSESQVTPHPEA